MTSQINDPLDVMPVFVNQLASSGCLNGVVNVAFATALFTPDDAAQNGVAVDLVITSQLRMDLLCAQQLRDRLTQIIEQNTKPARATEH